MELKVVVEELRIYINSMSFYCYEDGVFEDVFSKLNGMGYKFGKSLVEIGNV